MIVCYETIKVSLMTELLIPKPLVDMPMATLMIENKTRLFVNPAVKLATTPINP